MAGHPGSAVAAGLNVLDLAIIGTGFGGIGAAVMATRRGITSFVLLERSWAVGGTWRDNTYPGCACDIPSNLYSFSFAQNPDWTRTYPTQPELEAYLERVVDDFGLRSSIDFGFEVGTLRWDDAELLWHVIATDGREVLARSVISATGPLSQPATPSIRGLDEFEGPVFHSARWDHDADLRGLRVGVVGTGASAIQLVPALADTVRSLTVFQRTAPWVLPRDDRPTPSWRRRLYGRVPFLQRLHRWRVYLRQERLVVAFIGGGRLARAFRERVRIEVRAAIEAAFPDPVDVERLLPEYEPGCKRILISSDWYRTLAREDVDLVSTPIEHVTHRGVRTSDGGEVDLDAIVLATGFAVSSFPAPMVVLGRGGEDLRDHWSEGSRSELGLAVAGFPNLWFLIGPGTGLGHNSMVFMIESQLHTVADALDHGRRHGIAAMELRPEFEQAAWAERSRRSTGTVWSTGCASWYLDDAGRVDAVWPGTTIEYWWRTRRFRPERFRPVESVPPSTRRFGRAGAVG